MPYVSNSDVLYRRKKNPYTGTTATRSSGYGYGKLASQLLGAYIGNKKFPKGRVKFKKATLGSVLTRQTRTSARTYEGENSMSKCNFGYHKSPIPVSILNNLARQNYVYNYGYAASAGTGVQNYTEINLMDPSIISLIQSDYDRILIHGFQAEVQLVNSSSTANQLMIYDVICRKDCATASKNSSPGTAWALGVDIEGGSSTDYNTIGSRPTESVAFNTFYKIVQKTPLTLSPGELHRHLVRFNPNRMVNGFWNDAAIYGMQGLTCWTLIVHHGQPAHDSTTATSVTIDPSELDIVWKTSIDYRMMDKSTAIWGKTNNLATSFAVGEQFVNEAVGQVQDSGGLHPGTLHT